MKSIRDRIKKYFQNNKRWKIAVDLIFYIFIILLIIPATRKPVSTTLIRLTMLKPRVENNEGLRSLTELDKDFSIRDFKNNDHTLGNFENEVILLNFWATWCPPCRAEMPAIQKLYNDYGEKIAMILVTSEEKEVVREYLNEFNYDLPVYFQTAPLPPSLKVTSIPTTFLIDKKGNIITEKKGAANWNSASFRSELDHLLRQ
ncbi:MAG: TlpA family protein disulfide reductase [Bacteroidota bacterium]